MTNAIPPFDAGNRRRRNRIFFGLILILAGFLLLLQRFTNFEFRNWWALFLLIPAFGALSTGWLIYQNTGRINESVRGSLNGSLLLLTIAAMFLANLDWAIWWPLVVIVPGILLLLNGFSLPGSHERERPLALRLHRPWIGWSGLGVLFLGVGFLSNQLGIFNLAAILPRWWAIAILIPAFGGIITALRLLASGNGFKWAAISNLLTTSIFGVVGVVALTGLDWNLLFPIFIIATGILLLLGVFRR